MNLQEILSKCDHTLLSPTAKLAEILAVCDEGLAFHTASVCIPPSFVRRAKDRVGDRLAVCTVIGFPNGYTTAEAKVFETRNALENGADEIDMVIDLGFVKDGDFDAVKREIEAVKKACGSHILKVIVETCLLTREEKIRLCAVTAEAGADFIKTSTGFSTGGATPEDIALFAEHRRPGLKIKAAGGIRTIGDAEKLIELGADRLGTSRIVAAAKQLRKDGRV